MGLRPVAEMQFIDFVAGAYDMLTNYVATARYRAGLATPIVVRGPAGGVCRVGAGPSRAVAEASRARIWRRMCARREARSEGRFGWVGCGGRRER